jgi:hypothetical protein
MSTRPSPTGALCSLVASIIIAGTAFATDEPPAAPPAPSKEMRVKMASVHEQMAACLRSEKSIAECRDEMMKDCREQMGEQGCPMMGKGIDMHDPMMNKPCPDAAGGR